MPYKDINKRRECQRVYANKRYHSNPERFREEGRKWRVNNPEKLRAAQTAPKRQFIEAFGGACQCCGVAYYEFLTLEHVNGRIKGEPTGDAMYRKARLEGYPRDKYACLCANCNLAKGLFGICPHERERQAATNS